MTKGLYALFETDPELELKGVGFRFGVATFYCKRAGGANTEFDRVFEEKTRTMTSRLQLAALTNEQSSAILREVYAEAVMIGWAGVTDREGKELPFNKENFVRVMTDLPVVWSALRQECGDHSNFLKAQAKQEGEALGNS